MAVDLSVKVSDKVTFKNPYVSAGGPVAGTVEHIKRLVDAGFGAICTKTASNFKEFQRYPRPLYYVYNYRRHSEDAFYADTWDWQHHDHNSQYPPDKFVEIIRRVAPYCKKNDCTLIGTFAGAGVDQWVSIAEAYVEAGAGALELNFCCPYPQDMVSVAKTEKEALIGESFADRPEGALEVIRAVKKAVPGVPIFPKMPPTSRSAIVKLAKMYEGAGSEGITMYANARVARIDIETGKPIGYGAGIGTTPGNMQEVLYDTIQVALSTKLAIMSGRGARTWRDCVEFILGGATGVQYSVAVMFYGLPYVGELVRGLEGYMERRGFKTIDEMRGASLKYVLKPAEVRHKVAPLVGKVDGSRCIGCGRCKAVCWYDAITVHTKGLAGVAKIDPKHCVGCTLCSQVCPETAIDYSERPDEDYVRALFAGHPDLAPDDVKF